MILRPYVEYLKMAKEKIDDLLAPIRAHKAKKQAELEIAKLEEEIATKETKINELCTEKELNFKCIIDAQDDLALLERRKKQFVTITEQLFPK